MVSKRDGNGSRARVPILAITAVLVAVAAAVVGVRISSNVAGASPSAATTLALQGSSASAVPAIVAVSPLDLVSSEPASGAKAVATNSDIKLTFSSSVEMSVLPKLSPYVAGNWSKDGPDTLEFVPSAPFVPYTKEVVTLPGGPGGISGANGRTLANSTSFSFTVASGSVMRLQQLLAQLGYLPLSFVPQSAAPVPPSSMALPQPGSFTWRWKKLPTSLTSLWSSGNMNVVTKGAIMRFEDQTGLKTDGLAGPEVWSHLLDAVASGATDKLPYDYVTVTKARPEHVTVYSNGKSVLVTLANTGVAAAPTINGTFTVYLRYKSTTMSGTNPNGTHYVDHNVPWVSYFNGSQGLHGFVRPGYGYPQSVGCVEMPIPEAAKVWPLTPIGTLVTVE